MTEEAGGVIIAALRLTKTEGGLQQSQLLRSKACLGNLCLSQPGGEGILSVPHEKAPPRGFVGASACRGVELLGEPPDKSDQGVAWKPLAGEVAARFTLRIAYFAAGST